MDSIKILYVEDEASLAMIVKESLETRGFEVHLITDGAKALEAYKRIEPDVCVLDIMLPNINGFDIGKSIRHIDQHIPILYLTAKVQTKDVLEGFEAGGNDYLKKPFSMEELIIRIQNLYRMSGGAVRTIVQEFQFGGTKFYPRKHELQIGDDTVQLSHRESQLLETLCRHQNDTCLRKQILLDLWGDDSYFNSRSLDVYINKMRKYLAKDSTAQIVTLKGVGYLFKVD